MDCKERERIIGDISSDGWVALTHDMAMLEELLPKYPGVYRYLDADFRHVYECLSKQRDSKIQ